MADLVVTPMAAAIAGSGWFAAKALGPAVDAAGSALAQFVTDRTNKIFRKAEAKAEPENAKPLPVGFLYLAMQKASFSEDSEVLTDMWASLLVDASANISHRHTVFADVLTQVGSDGAQFLLEMVGSSAWQFHLTNEVGLTDSIYQQYRKNLTWEQVSEQKALELAEKLLDTNIFWPVVNKMASYTYTIPGKNPAATGTKVVNRPAPDPLMIDILSRQRLVQEFDFDFHPGWASPRLAGIHLTTLGLDLVKTCHKPDVRQPSDTPS